MEAMSEKADVQQIVLGPEIHRRKNLKSARENPWTRET